MIKYKTVGGSLTYMHEFDAGMEKATSKFEEEGCRVVNQNFVMSGAMIACVFEYLDAEFLKKIEAEQKAMEEKKIEEMNQQIYGMSKPLIEPEGIPASIIDGSIVPKKKTTKKKASGKSGKATTDKA